MKAKATFRIDAWDYVVILPEVQNLYQPEKVASGWQYGLKYKSGVFEYFQCKTKEQAIRGLENLEDAINLFYREIYLLPQ